MKITLDEKAKTITIIANYDPKGVPQKAHKLKDGSMSEAGDGVIHCKAGGGWPIRTGVHNSLGNELTIGFTVLSHPAKKADGVKPMQA
jgi:hypothetical protein